jgi:predicted MFS family arabinose efflux permease
MLSVAVAINDAGLALPLARGLRDRRRDRDVYRQAAVDTSAHLAAVLALMKLTGATRLGATITLLAWGATGFGISPILQHQASRAAPRNPEVVCSAGGADRVSAHGAPCGGISRARSRIG